MTEERKEYILTIAKYFVLTGKSTRQLSGVFKVSNFTIHSILTKQLEQLYLETRNKEYLDLYKEVQDVLQKNKNNKSVEDADIRKRVLEASKLLLTGKTVSEIAEILNSSFYTIYRDLTVRLPKINGIDSEVVNNVQLTMHTNKEINLELGRIMPAGNSRDEKGRFI